MVMSRAEEILRIPELWMIDGKDNAHAGQNEAQKQADAACNGHWNSCQEVRQFFHTISSQTLDAPKQIRYSIFITECFV